MRGFFVEQEIVVEKNSDCTIVRVIETEENEADFPTRSNAYFLGEVLGKYKSLHYLSRKEIRCDNKYPAPTVSLMFQAAHAAFDGHVSLSLSPVVLWYAITHEIAIYVKKHSQECAKYFTTSPEEKKKIEVRDDSLIYGGTSDWGRCIGLIRKPLREFIAPEVLDVFLPGFSAMSPEDETAILVSFMDVISEYYNFECITACGIPRIRLEGSLDDWKLLVSSTEKLAELFGIKDLSLYFANLVPVLRTIRDTVETGVGNPDFWTSVYKVNDGSGGPYINGWLTALTAYRPTPVGFELRESFDWKSGWRGLTTEDFPAHVSKVQFNWNYYGTDIPMAFFAGVLGIDNDEFLTPKLGFGVIELDAK